MRDCLLMEHRIVASFLRGKGDFKEGIRAVLVGKDNKQNWNPKTLSEVSG